MQIARVVGTVVSTTKSEKLTGLKMMLVKPIDLETFEEKGNILVAFDAVGAGGRGGDDCLRFFLETDRGNRK